jgi:glycosyltransferase involved in cell wall biosynthesis
MREVRVCAIAFDYYPFEPRFRRIAEAAADAGYSASVICLRARGELPYEVCNGVRTYRVPQRRAYNGSFFTAALSWVWFTVLAGVVLTWLQLRHRYDVVIAHNMPDFLVFAALVPKLLGACVILDVEDVSPELMAAKASGKLAKRVLWRLAVWQERISTAFADRVMTTGSPFEDLLVQRGVPRDRQIIVINSADPKLFPMDRLQAPPPGDDADRPFIFMYYGTVARRNGLDTAIRALAIASAVEPRLQLDIMGLGEEMPALRTLAGELGVGDRVRFFPPCQSDEIVTFIEHGDAAIIPYRCDGFAEFVLPTKAYEMAWAHRPIVASDTPAIRSMFRPTSIKLCDPESPEAFARAMVEICQQPALRQELAAAAAEDYAPMRWDVVRQEYQRVLGELAGRPTLPLVQARTQEPVATRPSGDR